MDVDRQALAEPELEIAQRLACRRRCNARYKRRKPQYSRAELPVIPEGIADLGYISCCPIGAAVHWLGPIVIRSDLRDKQPRLQDQNLSSDAAPRLLDAVIKRAAVTPQAHQPGECAPTAHRESCSAPR